MDNTITEKELMPAPPGDGATTAVEPAHFTPEQLSELEARAAKADENWDRFLRLAAEFENFRKRATREQQDARKFALEGLLRNLLPALDNFDMAMQAAADPEKTTVDSIKSGVAMIQQQLRSALKDAGLEEVDAAGAVFDPNLHEAVSQAESPDVPDGQVLQQLRRGYKLNGRLLRPATVIVAKAPAAA